jgi:hypothetical protein
MKSSRELRPGLEPPDLVCHTNAQKEQRLDLSIEPFDIDSSMDMPATTLMRLKVLYSKISLASAASTNGWMRTGRLDMRNSERSRKEIYAAFLTGLHIRSMYCVPRGLKSPLLKAIHNSNISSVRYVGPSAGLVACHPLT